MSDRHKMGGVIVEIMLKAVGPNGNETQAFLGWLVENPQLSNKVRLTASGTIEGAQGPGSDALAVALGGGGSLTALALSLKTWIEAYYAQRKTNVHVEVTGKDGRKAVVDASNASDAEAILHQITS